MIAANHKHDHDQTPSPPTVRRRGQKIGAGAGVGGGRWGASVGWAVVVTIVGWIGFATVAVAHPHEWYDVIAAEAVIGENAAVAEIRLRLLPEPFTHASLIMAADADGDGVLSSAELAELEAMYAPIWEQVRYFTHPTLNGKTLLDMRGQRPKFVSIVGPDGQPWLEARVSVTVTIDEPLKRINNFTVLVADMSLYSALAIRPGSASVRLAPPARAISVVQPDRGRFRVTFVWPDPATTDTATDASNTHHTNTGNTDTDATVGPIAALPVENNGSGSSSGDVWMAEAPTETSVAEWIAESAQWAQNEAYTRFVTLRAGLDLNVLAVLILMAMVWGMLHALGPGHGKGLVAAFLVQSNGRLRDALKLGFLIAYVHTGGAILLVGAVKLAADIVQQKQFLDGAEAWLGFASGCAIALLGGWLVWERLSGGHHDHHDETAPAGTANLRKMALAVGIVPCPAATIVMLLALSAQAFWIGAMVVVALAFGIAIVLSGVGALVVVSRRRLTAAVAHLTNDQHQTQTARRSTTPNRAVPAPVAAVTPAFATASVAPATVVAADGFTRDADIEWLDDADDPGTGNGPGGAISTVTTDAETAEMAVVAEAVAVDRRPRALRVLEQVLGVGGAVMVSIFGVGLAWYYAVWVLPRFLGH